MNSSIEIAFNHVKESFPNLSIVVFGIDGRWSYMDEDFKPLNFSNSNVDSSILEDALDSIDVELPYAYQPIQLTDEVMRAITVMGLLNNDIDENANIEYLRGQCELIADMFTISYGACLSENCIMVAKAAKIPLATINKMW